jgi:arsenate reductase (thioredoxin)
MRKQKVLFLCTQNSGRSQMAEGFLRHLAGDRFEVYSAGIDPTDEIHPCAVEAISEVGIDISEQHPKGLRTYLGKMGFNYLIIVCARAEERCPKTFPVLAPPSRGSSRTRTGTRRSPTTRCLKGSARYATRSS